MYQSNDKLFSTHTIGQLTLKNRIVMAPMTRQASPGNIVNDEVVKYYSARAKDGVGLIITEGTCINHCAANGYENVPYIYGKAALVGWKKVVDAVHQHGGKIFPQLWHVGAMRELGKEPDPTVPAYSPSGFMAPGNPTGVVMSQQDIKDVIDGFVKAAVDAKAIGFDGIELHGAHGYLIDQFFWQGTNQRSDEYGGSMENRSRFAVEIIKAIRARVGNNFPICLRISQWKQQSFTSRLVETPEQLNEFLQPLVDAGVDIFHCSTRRFWQPEFEGSELNLAGWVKKLTGKTTISVGSVGLDAAYIEKDKEGLITADDLTESAQPTSLANLVTRLKADEFDLAAVGRAILVDPHWVSKVKENRIEDILPFKKEAILTLSY